MAFSSCRKNGSIRKIWLILKSIQAVAKHILGSISRSIDNQAMRFGQLIEYIFIEKSYTKCAEQTIPRPLSKKSKLIISLDQ